MHRRLMPLSIAAAVLALALTGCSALGGDDKDAAAGAPAAEQGAAGPGSGAQAGAQPGSSAAGKSQPGSDEPAAGTFTVASGTVTASIQGLRVTGQLLRMTMVVTNADSQAFQIAQSFSSLDDLAGVILEDTVNLQRYPVATTPEGCACSNDLTNVWVRSGQPVTLFANFKVPAAGVDKLDIIFPKGIARIDGVPVQR